MNGRITPPGAETLLGVPRRKSRDANMPKNTRVAKCVEEVKKKGGPYNAYAVCQKSTGESYRTGKPPKSKGAKKKGK